MLQSLLHTASKKLDFKTWKAVFTNVRFRFSSSKPLSVNAALILTDDAVSLYRYILLKLVINVQALVFLLNLSENKFLIFYVISGLSFFL